MSNLLQVNKIEPQTVDIFYDNNGAQFFIGNVNELELLDLRLRIKNESLAGYYVYFNNQKIPISSKGDLLDWPKGLFDQFDNYLMKLFV